MDNILTILNSNLIIGLLFFLVIVPVYHRLGLLSWLLGKTENKQEDRQENTNTDVQKQIIILTEHARVANEEMGEIQRDFRVMRESFTEVQKDIAFIRGQMSK